MRPAVHAVWHPWSEPLEGRVPFMYLDTHEPRGLVTVGVGNLLPMSEAVRYPFVHPDGRRATAAEIAAAWRAVDARQDLKNHGGMVFRNVTTLRLTSESIDRIVEAKLRSVDAQLAKLFPAWDEWPADAQLALLSWAWAAGAAAKYPKMIAFLRAREFALAATECTLNPQRGTIIERNRRNRILLGNAQRVVADGLDPSILYYPKVLTEEPATEPELDDPESDEPTRILDFPIVHPMPDTVPGDDDKGGQS